MMKTPLLALLLLFLFAAVSHSQAMPSAWASLASEQVRDAWAAGSWQAIAIASLLISFFLISIAYMASTLIGSPELKMWAKGEFLQAAASSMFVLIFIFLVNVLIISASEIAFNIASQNTLLPPSFSDEQRYDPFALAHFYLNTQISCAKIYYREVFALNYLPEMIEKTVMPTGGGEELSGWLFSGIVGTNYWIEHQLSFILLADYFQRHLLMFIEDNAFTVLLPIAVALRVLPYTRGAGGVLMSVALGVFLIYPIMFAVLTSALPVSSCAPQQAVLQPYEIPVGEGVDAELVARTTSLMQDNNFFEDTMGALNMRLRDLQMMFVSSLVFPIVNLTVTLTFIRATMQFFGADVAEMGRGLIKII